MTFFLRSPRGWELESMSPASFGLVMATGIISISAHLLGSPSVAFFLFNLNIGFFVILWLLTLWRMISYPKPFLKDLGSYIRGSGFFTTVAATNILGSQFVILDANDTLGSCLWALGGLLWIILTYTFFTKITIQSEKPTLENGLSGSWLLAVVATQSVTVLGGLLARHNDLFRMPLIEFLILIMWLAGGVLYLLIIVLIFFRYLFLNFSPADLSPSYWINMGAMAISTLAGTQLIANASDSILLLDILPFLKGLTLLFWSTGTWWIPLLIVLEVWRHIYKRYPIHYDPLYWGLTFPLGMYAASTHAMFQTLDLHFLYSIPHIFFYAAMLAWATAFTGLIHEVWRRLASVRDSA